MICIRFGKEVLRGDWPDLHGIGSKVLGKNLLQGTKTKIRDYDRAKRMQTAAYNPNQSPIHNSRTSPHSHARVVEHELGAIRGGITNSNPQNHTQVVEHKLGANPRGITRIRVARTLSNLRMSL